MKNNYLKTRNSTQTNLRSVKTLKEKSYNKKSNQVKKITGRRDN